MTQNAEPAVFVRLTVDGEGVSHFVEHQIPMEARDFAPPAAPLEVSGVVPATAAVFWRAPSGWDGRQHPAPARQWAFVLQGLLEVTASDGETRRLGPGDGVLLEDVTGAGHTTRVVGDDAAVGVFVQVPDDHPSDV